LLAARKKPLAFAVISGLDAKDTIQRIPKDRNHGHRWLTAEIAAGLIAINATVN
jgi:hypothetical protein